MRRGFAAAFATLAMTAGSVAAAAPAIADAPCVGTQNTLAVCIDPTGGVLYEDCVYVGEPPCIPVTVPGPVVWCEGAMSPNCDPWH